jgi:rfaE bifunctional protein kinase chain/domain
MKDINEVLAAFKRLNVLIIGDIMLDRYIYGNMDRISPEAPVPIINWKNSNERPGGAANVALNIQSLGANAILCGVIGVDEAGKRIMQLLPERGIGIEAILTSEERCTTTKTRVLAQHQQVLRLDKEDTFDLKTKETKKLSKKLALIFKNNQIDVILFQDYNKGVLTKAIIQQVFHAAKKNNIPTVVDPKNKRFFAYKGATLFKPNLLEVNAKLPFIIQAKLNDLNKADAFLRTKLNHQFTLITLADKGVYFNDINRAEVLPTNPRKIVDVCGAGDAVISIAALGIALHLPLKLIAQLANLAGGQICESVGVVPLSIEKLKTDFEVFCKKK